MQNTARQAEIPLISVIMGVYYQREECALLERSVRSILDQTLSSFELLICDDGSNDTARELLDRLAQKDGRIVLVRGTAAYSLPEKLNVCLERARGVWIARMDDDDYAAPERFRRQLDFLEEHPKVAFVGSNVRLIRDGQAVGQRILPEYPTIEDFYMVQPYIHPALIFRREVLETVGGYSREKTVLLCEDYDLLLRLYANGYRGSNLQELLLDYTIPLTAKGNRKMSHRWNEAVTRFRRFRQLGRLPGALPYVIKPLAVGLLPETVLRKLKRL